MKRMENAYQILVGTPEGKNYSEHIGGDVKIILDLILGK
jgi:hypothetical protein